MERRQLRTLFSTYIKPIAKAYIPRRPIKQRQNGMGIYAAGLSQMKMAAMKLARSDRDRIQTVIILNTSIDEFLFSDDPYLSEAEKTRNQSRGGNGVITVKKNEKGIWVGKRDIILGKNIPNY
jgi:hypothetical protein